MPLIPFLNESEDDVRAFLTMAISVAAAGCATVPQQQTPAGTTYLVCGASRLDISHDGRTAVVRDSEGRETLLQRADSSLGTRYAGGGISVLRSGDTYVYNAPNGAALACAPLQR